MNRKLLVLIQTLIMTGSIQAKTFFESKATPNLLNIVTDDVDLLITKGNQFKIYSDYNNPKDVDVKYDSSKGSIKIKYQKTAIGKPSSKVIIELPLDQVDLNISSEDGNVNIENIVINKLNMNLEDGNVVVKDSKFKSASNIATTDGNITIVDKNKLVNSIDAYIKDSGEIVGEDKLKHKLFGDIKNSSPLTLVTDDGSILISK